MEIQCWTDWRFWISAGRVAWRLQHGHIPIVISNKVSFAFAHLLVIFKYYNSIEILDSKKADGMQWRRQGGGGGACAPWKILCLPMCPPSEICDAKFCICHYLMVPPHQTAVPPLCPSQNKKSGDATDGMSARVANLGL